MTSSQLRNPPAAQTFASFLRQLRFLHSTTNEAQFPRDSSDPSHAPLLPLGSGAMKKCPSTSRTVKIVDPSRDISV